MNQQPHPARRILKASHAGYQVLRWTEAGPIRAQVLGVFQRACNLQTSEGRLVTLLAPDRPGPANIVVPALGQVLGQVKDDQSMTITPIRVEAPQANLMIDLSSTPIWAGVAPPNLPLPTPPARRAAVQVAMGIALSRAESAELIHLLPELAGETDTGPASPAPKAGLGPSLEAGMRHQARSAVSQLGTSLATGELEAALDAATHLVGLGLGLTPSGDDLLTGLILALKIADQAPGSEVSGIDAFGQEVVERAVARTTLVSVEQMRYAARGETEETIAEAAIALLWAREPLQPAIDALLDTGSSSGADLLAGMCIASTHLPVLLRRSDPYQGSCGTCEA